MLEVYRVEHTDTGIGPYQTNDTYTQSLAEKLNEKSHLKRPFDDGILMSDVPFFYVFGCTSIDSLKDWFLLGNNPEDNYTIVENLKNKGFRIAQFIVEPDYYEVGNSGMQVVFDSHRCKEDGLVQFHELDMIL